MSEKTLPSFTTTGVHHKDYYLINGSPNFAVIPAKRIKDIDVDMPIRLPYGNALFGANHIMHKHGKWVLENEKTGCVATFVWRKLSQRGSIHVEQVSKLSLCLKMNPGALLGLKKLDGFYSVTTMYFYDRPPKGQTLGNYYGHHWATAADANSSDNSAVVKTSQLDVGP